MPWKHPRAPLLRSGRGERAGGACPANLLTSWGCDVSLHFTPLASLAVVRGGLNTHLHSNSHSFTRFHLRGSHSSVGHSISLQSSRVAEPTAGCGALERIERPE